MFKIAQSESYSWPVTVEVPTDGGAHDAQSFDGVFKRLPQSRIDELMKGSITKSLRDKDVADEVLIGWKDVQDENGAEVPFTTDTKARLLEVQLVAAAVVNALMDSLYGAKRKN